MTLFLAAISLVFALLLLLAIATRIGARAIERRHPPVGTFVEVNGARLHVVHIPAGGKAGLPPLVFIHGASGNLLDQMVPIRMMLEGRATMLFFDRPGHGWSERGDANETPSAQARTLAALMDRLGITDAVIIGHSFGGALAAAFALEFPQRTRGLLFLAAATHPWPGAQTSWYYKLAAMPVLGRLFVETLAWPGGMLRIKAASKGVFAPNEMPQTYIHDVAIPLVLRPAAFRANARDVHGLYAHVAEASRRYGEISVPTVVVSGNRDSVVYEEIHSLGLACDIPGAELVWVDNLGHKPEWIAPDLVVAAIEKIAGYPRDIQAAARSVERRIAADENQAGFSAVSTSLTQ